MKVAVDSKLCIGCGLCSELVPSAFEMYEGKTGMLSRVKKQADFSSKKSMEEVKDAAKACPSEAIKVN